MSRTVRPKPTAEEELKLLSDLMAEQTPNAVARALIDARKTSATWVAKGDHMVLLVVDGTNSKAIKRTLYKCRVLDVVIEESKR